MQEIVFCIELLWAMRRETIWRIPNANSFGFYLVRHQQRQQQQDKTAKSLRKESYVLRLVGPEGNCVLWSAQTMRNCQ